MSNYQFTSSSYAMWFMAGEYSLKYGKPALIFPLLEKQLILNFNKDDSKLLFQSNLPHDVAFRVILWSLISEALKLLNQNPLQFKGHLYMENRIPIAAGLGFTSALSLVLTKLFHWLKWLPEKDMLNFAMQLKKYISREAHFPDEACVINDKGLYFTPGGDVNYFSPSWQPRIYLLQKKDLHSVNPNDTNNIASLYKDNNDKAAEIDLQMEKCVSDAEYALTINEEAGFPILTDAINRTRTCHKDWGLINKELDNVYNEFLEKGASAVKSIGRIDSGLIISLWKDIPPHDLAENLLPVRMCACESAVA